MRGSAPTEERTRIALAIHGTVQGVGFRPFAWSLANRLALGGSIRNATDAVLVEIEGEGRAVEAFVEAVRREAPPLACIERIERTAIAPRNERTFVIAPSAADARTPAPVAPDTATCDECVRELFDPRDRRYGHPFVNCTSCGPRFTIVEAMPYDRAATTMAAFPMCAKCRVEYEDPKNRRFHAQPIACNDCGPKLAFEPGRGGSDPISAAAAAIAEGKIVALKGLGGYHLACDATNGSAVEALRERKRRDAKPFAVMVADIDEAEQLGHVSDVERTLLLSAARPIVLVRRRSRVVVDAVAPGLDRIGLFLPYTPVHHLLLSACARPLVTTSANVTEEPIAFEDDDARTRLRGIADAFVVHDRVIRTRCDDSIAHEVDGAPAVLRRSRGHAPRSLPLPHALAKPTLALGGQLKAVFAVGRSSTAVLGHHIGDLDDFKAYRSYVDALAHLRDLLGATPERVVCDQHPDYATTRLAHELAASGMELACVQHHEAHVAACLAGAGIDRHAVGVAFDGAGFGTDGAVWGGEFFTGTLGTLRRAAHLRYVPLPGGDGAARDPWRMAVAHLVDAGVDPTEVLDVDPSEIALVSQVAKRLSPPTSSVGRLFDAVAAILGIRTRSHHEAHAAMELQAAAERATDDARYPYDVAGGGDLLELDARPLIRAIVEDRSGPEIAARRFHATLAHATADLCAHLAGDARDVALSGGVFANALFARLTCDAVRARGLSPWLCRSIPTNDGGLAFGQLAVVGARDGGV